MNEASTGTAGADAGAAPATPAAVASLDRRRLLLAVSLLAAALGLPGSAASRAEGAANAGGIGMDSFRDLSVALTGFAPRDASLAESFRDAFAAEAADLARLHEIVRHQPPGAWDAAIAAAGLAPLAEALVTAWYTGMVGEGADRRVVSYLDAFVWYAVGYTKPPSQCDWGFGAWADPPPPGRFPG
jgi:fructose 5-dehydrogenase small subunit